MKSLLILYLLSFGAFAQEDQSSQEAQVNSLPKSMVSITETVLFHNKVQDTSDSDQSKIKEYLEIRGFADTVQ